MQIRREHLIMGVKAALGAAAAIGLAMLLGLEYASTAGIICILSLMGTKRETLRIAAGRLTALLLGTGIAAASYHLLGFSLVLIRFSRKRILLRLDALARKDAKALRLRNPQRYALIRRNLFSEPLTCNSAPCSVAFRSL